MKKWLYAGLLALVALTASLAVKCDGNALRDDGDGIGTSPS